MVARRATLLGVFRHFQLPGETDKQLRSNPVIVVCVCDTFIYVCDFISNYLQP